MAKKLYVGNLAFQTTSQDLQTLFAEAGTVESASAVKRYTVIVSERSPRNWPCTLIKGETGIGQSSIT